MLNGVVEIKPDTPPEAGLPMFIDSYVEYYDKK